MIEIEDALLGILSRKARDLFAAYEVPCTETASAIEDHAHLCGIVSFTGVNLSGSVIVTGTREAIEDSNPGRRCGTRAWLAELSNQLVGRIKNGLLRRGVDVAQSIPIVLGGARIVPMSDRAISPLHFDVGRGRISVWCEVEHHGLVVGEEDLTAGVASEGDVIVF